MNSLRDRMGFLLFLPFAIALAAFWPATRGTFVLDDQSYIVRNPSVTGEAGIFDSALPPDQPDLGLYRPITVLTYRMQHAISGLDPVAFRQGNVLLHATTSALIVPAAMALGASGTLAVVCAVLFAVHPIHVEAVAWIVGRAEILATIFALWMLILNSRSDRFEPKRTLAVSMCLAIAALAKESAMPFPAVLVLIDLLRGVPRRVIAARTLCYAVTLIAIVLARIAVLGRFGPDVSAHPILGDIAPLERAELAVRILGFALRSLVVPDALSIWYEPRIFGGALRLALGLAIVFGSFAFLAHAVRTQHRLPAIGFGWFLIAMLPFLHLIPIGWVFGDRFLYLASAGFVLGVCAALGGLGLPVSVQRALTVAVAITFGTLAVARISVFHDDRALWEDAVAKDPESGFSHYQLAGILEQIGRFDYRSEDDRGAVFHWQEALRVDPSHLFAARCHAKLGDYQAFVVRDAARGAEEYRAAFALDPVARDPIVLDSLLRYATLREISVAQAIHALEVASAACTTAEQSSRAREAIAFVRTRTDLKDTDERRLTACEDRLRRTP